jgi:hypothetical protein
MRISLLEAAAILAIGITAVQIQPMETAQQGAALRLSNVRTDDRPPLPEALALTTKPPRARDAVTAAGN